MRMRLPQTRIDSIKESYIDPSHETAFGGINRLVKFHKIKQRNAEKVLSEIDSYTLHREYKKPKKRNPYYIYFRRQQVQCDLIDMRQLAKFNSNYSYLIVCIDGFSRKIWVEPLKTKSAKDVLKAMRTMIRDMVDKPVSIFCDRGSELKNTLVRSYLEENNIKLLHPFSEVKAGFAERVNRTLQNLIYRYMTENETRTYIPRLRLLVEGYNERPHSSIDNLSPNDADQPENADKVVSALRQHYFSLEPKKKVLKFNIGDTVRCKINYGNRFARGYEEQFSRELFKVVSLNTRMAIPMYTIKSLDTDEEIAGSWYSNELQLHSSPIFKVERVLKTRMTRGRKEYFVKWLNFGEQHNSWISATDIEKVYNV